MHPDSITYTTFISVFGNNEYLPMPINLKNARSVFQLMMDRVVVRVL